MKVNDRMEQIANREIEANNTGEFYLSRAYWMGKESGIDAPVFEYDCLWDRDIADIAAAIHATGITKIYVANKESGLLDTLALFQDNGGRMGGIQRLEMKREWRDDPDCVPAIEINF